MADDGPVRDRIGRVRRRCRWQRNAIIGRGHAGAIRQRPGHVTGAAARELQLTDADNGTTVRLARDGRLIIAPQSNPSTGFSWFVGAMAGPELQLSGEPVYAPPDSTAPVAGAPGTQVFTFITTGIGMPPAGTMAVVQMVLEYRRPFEPDVPPAKTFNLTVEID